MHVEILRATENPVEIISIAAGTCYGRPNVSKKRVETCFNSGHMSVFEHASITARVEGISRACMAQLTRHRLCSFCVESQRYNKYDLNGDEWYVVPPIFDSDEEAREFFEEQMVDCAVTYETALGEGVKPEDARYLLPEAMKTNLIMTCNLRELYHLFDLRLGKGAQWEIKDLATCIRSALMVPDKEWQFLMNLWSEDK